MRTNTLTAGFSETLFREMNSFHLVDEVANGPIMQNIA